LPLPDLSGGPWRPLFLVAGPCAIEGEQMLLDSAGELAEICAALQIELVFKASYDKANRTSGGSARGVGIDAGLEALAKVRDRAGVPVMTDVHSDRDAARVAETCDVLQVPAFLCRQTDLVAACGATGKAVNIKKGQFMAPADMRHVAGKAAAAGASQVWLCERGASFGYGDLVVDMRSLVVMREAGYPVVYDATHSVQQPGAADGSSGGLRRLAAPLARAAVATGVSGLFAEAHPDPGRAISDSQTQLPLSRMREFLEPLVEIDRATKEAGRRGGWLEEKLEAQGE